jgi:enhancing lycopene biosynthesis protein 2
MKQVAVVLCGSGFKDGSEIRESVAALWALSQQPVKVHCFAPDLPQADVVNCLTGETTKETRNMLVEAARIARGKVKPLTDLNAKEFSAVIIPGGFGVAKNLCTFASKGSKGTVLPLLQEQLIAFHAAHKPIGAICIAPAVIALAFEGKGFELTVGPKSEASQEIEKLGHRHVVKRADEFHLDLVHRIVTSPAYMIDDAELHLVFTGVHKLVNEVVHLA